MTLADLILDFIFAVQRFTTVQSEATRVHALDLHARIDATMEPDDSRREHLAALRKLLSEVE